MTEPFPTVEVGGLVGGLVGDRRGRRRLVILCNVLSFAANILCLVSLAILRHVSIVF